MSSGRGNVQPVADSNVDGMVLQVGGQQNRLFLSGGIAAGKVLFLSKQIDGLDAQIPVVANPAFLAAVGTDVGQTLNVTLDGTRRELLVAGSVDAFPTTDPAQPLLVLDQPTLDLMRLQATSGVRNVDEWWMSVAPGTSGAGQRGAARGAVRKPQRGQRRRTRPRPDD